MQFARIAAVGDVCPGDHYFSLGHGAGSIGESGRRKALGSLSKILHEADIAIANLEGVLSESSETLDPVESRVFRGPSEWAGSLRSAGFTAMNVANNHSLQHGETAFWNTVRACRDAGLDVIGLAGPDGLPCPVFRRTGGTDIALIGASFVPDQRRHAGSRTYAHPSLENLVEQTHALARSGRAVIVCVHIGAEGLSLPDRTTMLAVHALASAGARGVLVHHSHIFQPVLKICDAIVATGLGDCLFDLHWHRALTISAVVTLELSDQNEDTFSLYPFRMTRQLRVEELFDGDLDWFLGDLALRTGRLMGCRDTVIANPKWLQARKAMYFLGNLGRGDTGAKLRFLSRKAIQVTRHLL